MARVEVLGDHDLILREQLVVVAVQPILTIWGPKDWVSFTKPGCERTYPAPMTLVTNRGRYQFGDVVGLALMKKPERMPSLT